MLTVKQVAERLTVSEALVYLWIQAGAIPCYRLGLPGRRGSIRIAEADLEGFLAAHKHEPQEVKETKRASGKKPPVKYRHLKFD